MNRAPNAHGPGSGLDCHGGFSSLRPGLLKREYLIFTAQMIFLHLFASNLSLLFPPSITFSLLSLLCGKSLKSDYLHRLTL